MASAGSSRASEPPQPPTLTEATAPSPKTLEKAQAAKQYIENMTRNQTKMAAERLQRRRGLESAVAEAARSLCASKARK